MSRLRRPFESRVGARLVVLFGSCALLPLLALAALSYRSIRGHLIESGQEDLEVGSKSYAMSLIDRLDTLETTLLDLPTQLEGETTLSSGRSELLRSRFTEVGIGLPDGSYRQLIGVPESGRSALHAVWSSLEPGRSLLLPMASPLLVAPASGGGYVAGTSRADYLWWGTTLENTLPAATSLVVLDGRDVLFASQPVSSGLITRLSQAGSAHRRGAVLWEANGEAMLAGYWTVPLGIRFEASDWTIALVRSQEVVLSPLGRFQTPFLLVLLATFLGIFLLSLRQIALTLSPLEELKRGTERIAARDFDVRVSVASHDEFRELAGSFNEMAERIGSLVARLAGLQIGTLRALSRAIDERSRWTLGHSERVGSMCRRLARHLGLGEEEQETFYRAGLLHDVGKMRIPSEMLERPGPLTAAEKLLFQGHVPAGVRILEPIPEFEKILPIVAQHHERLDGSGYPEGLADDEIGLGARVLAVADTFDAMSSDRPYRERLSPEAIVAEFERCRGSLFDPSVVDAIIEICGFDEGLEAPALNLVT